MNGEFKQNFIEKWQKYFNVAELPITWYYSDTVDRFDLEESKNEYRCLIGNLNRVRSGFTFIYHSESPGCLGGKRYSGYSRDLRPNFEYFLSCGIPQEMEGERYKKSPELVRDYIKDNSPFEAPARYLVFKRWDRLREDENPLAVIFFAPADVLAGLFTLANFDVSYPQAVIAPMGSGCSSIISYVLNEISTNQPRCILGMFDISARPYVPPNTLTFTITMSRFEEMVKNMEDSFLITESWTKMIKRMV